MAEMKGFVFAVTFIILFSTFLISIPLDMQGSDAQPDTVITPVDPALLTDYSASEAFDTTDFIPWIGIFEIYEYILPVGGKEWISGTNGTAFDLNSKVYFLGLIWLGQLDPIRFTCINGTDRGLVITFDEMEGDAEDGTARYNLISATGNPAGGFIFYWNTTTYSGPSNAWDNNALYLLHGLGIDLNPDIASLLLSLLFLQLPNTPLLISVLLATPLWAMVIYLLWFIIISMVPFLGGA